MKRPLSLIDKLKIFRYWMKQHKDYALIASCSICNSIRINRLRWQEEIKGINDTVYTAEYKCMDCHATAEVVENWSRARGA